MQNDLEDFIHKNADRFETRTPNPKILNRVLKQMKQKNKSVTGVLIPFRVLRWAAACIVLLLIAFGLLTFPNKSENLAIQSAKEDHQSISKGLSIDTATQSVKEATKKEEYVVKSIDNIDTELSQRKKAIIAKLQSHNSVLQKQVVFTGLNNMESAANRISAATAAYHLRNEGNDVATVLIKTLNTDPNVNVRLAALDGLVHFYRNNFVRKKLIESLSKQQDPVIQITMINLLTRMRESGIISQLEKLVNNMQVQKEVKDCAYSGILQLRSYY